MNLEMPIPFDNSYVRLPAHFFARQKPTPVTQPALIRVNHALAKQLGIDPVWLESSAGVAVLAGNTIAAGADPIATAYAGHQFGGWNPQLGDGRAILLGEIVDHNGVRYDLQLKGSGRTPYSRGGDGRAPLGPVLREYVLSEAMAVLGVPTTRALAAVTTGETVVRDALLPGGVLARVAQSHIRIGTVQFLASRNDLDGLRQLVQYVIRRHYPTAAAAENPPLALLNAVIAAQARLIAKWQLLGFIHGVMNTDNMLLSGETIDYGPCAFIDTFHPDTVFSSIDHAGRYAYRKQPGIAQWNLACLAQSLVPLLDHDQDAAVAKAQAAIDTFPTLFLDAHRAGMNQKLGLTQAGDDDESLAEDLLQLMADQHCDFTLTFRRLADLVDESTAGTADVGTLIDLPSAFDTWLQRWRERLAREAQHPASVQAAMYNVNPVFIARNHLVEEVIQAAITRQDFAPFHQLLHVLESPFQFKPEFARYANPPQPEQIVSKTFCGT